MLLFFENFRLLFEPSTQKSRPFSSTDGFLRNVIALFYFLPVLQAPESLDITAFLIRTNHMQMLLLGFRVREIPAVMHARTAGVSMHSGLKPIVYMFRMTVSILAVWIREKILKMDEDKICELEKYDE